MPQQREIIHPELTQTSFESILSSYSWCPAQSRPMHGTMCPMSATCPTFLAAAATMLTKPILCSLRPSLCHCSLPFSGPFTPPASICPSATGINILSTLHRFALIISIKFNIMTFYKILIYIIFLSMHAEPSS